nr:leukocyte-associated immunoglobulin-like receptor 1 isoform X6 [Loxodonta africana]
MSLTPTTFLGLVLCLGPEIQAHNGSLPRPSISAEPGSMIRWGMPVTFVCQSPHGAEAFRLEKSKSNSYQDVKLSSGTEKEARFLINSVTTDTAGRYNCLYFTGNTYSERSEFLELVVTDTTRPQILSPELLYSLIGISVAFLLCLLLLVLFFIHRQCQRKHRIPRSKGKEQNPQERLSPGVDILNSTPDMARVDGLPENDREMDTSLFPGTSLQSLDCFQKPNYSCPVVSRDPATATQLFPETPLQTFSCFQRSSYGHSAVSRDSATVIQLFPETLQQPPSCFQGPSYSCPAVSRDPTICAQLIPQTQPQSPS